MHETLHGLQHPHYHADDQLSSSELRKRYLQGGLNDDQLSASQLRAKAGIPHNSKSTLLNCLCLRHACKLQFLLRRLEHKAIWRRPHHACSRCCCCCVGAWRSCVLHNWMRSFRSFTWPGLFLLLSLCWPHLSLRPSAEMCHIQIHFAKIVADSNLPALREWRALFEINFPFCKRTSTSRKAAADCRCGLRWS